MAQTYTIPHEVVERFNKLAELGRRSSIITKLIVGWCDEKEDQIYAKKIREHEIRTKHLPFIKNYAKANGLDPIDLLGKEYILKEMMKEGIEATLEDIKESVHIILLEER